MFPVEEKLGEQMGSRVFLLLFIRLIVDSFEATPETWLNDLCSY